MHGKKNFRVSLEAAEVDSNEVAIITVIVDGTSSKRSYKTNSNAFSGVSSTGWNKMI
jgi:flagellar basal body rod protein FlgC